MIIRQEESTPIGDYFHDNGIKKVFEKLSENVDEFEVETDELNVYCDSLISLLKGLKGQIKKVESASIKKKSQEKVEDLIQKGGIE